jgi:hypothetical protein
MKNLYRLRLPLRVFLLFTFSVVVGIAAAKNHGDERFRSNTTGKYIYNNACAACHGKSGRGRPQSRVGFDIPLPDFTDCGFATREPDADWYAVAHDGGPVRVFDRLMPAFGDTLTEEQLQKALDYIRGFCPDKAWPRGELNFPRALVTEKAFPEDEAVLEFSGTTDEPYAFEAQIVIEKRFGAGSQLEVILPFSVLQIENENSDKKRWGEGAKDMAIGLKSALFHNTSTGTIFSLGGEVFFPTGDEADGLSKGTTLFEPFIAFGQDLGVIGFVHANSGLELSMESSRAEHEGFGRIALGRSFDQAHFGRSWTPIVEAIFKIELEEPENIDWDIAPQLMVTLNQRQHIMASVGAQIPLNDFNERQIAVRAFLLWDWFDGGFFEGW